MAELEVSLLNLQENMDIPTVTFQLHPDVQAIVAEVRVQPAAEGSEQRPVAVSQN